MSIYDNDVTLTFSNGNTITGKFVNEPIGILISQRPSDDFVNFSQKNGNTYSPIYVRWDAIIMIVPPA